VKKLPVLLLTALCLLLLSAFAQEAAPFVLQEHMVLPGMDRSWYQGYEPMVSGESLTIHLPLASKTAQRKVTAALVLDDPQISPIRGEKTSATFTKKDGIYPVELSLKLSPNCINGDYTGRVLIKGEDKDGQKLLAEFPVVLRIRTGKSEPGVRCAIANVAGALSVGEEGQIAARIQNTSRYCEMTNILLTVTDESGDILPKGSDILRIADLAPGEELLIEYPVLVKPDASVALHEAEFRLSYMAAGAQENWTETFTLPVGQEIRLEQGGVQMAQSVIQGEMATLTVPLMNMGKGELHNVMATLALPGITDKQSVLVGTIGPGETKQAKISFTPGKEALGEIEGAVTISCEDAWGNRTSFDLPTSVVVEAPAPVVQQAVSIAQEAQQKNPYILYILLGTCAALAFGFVLQGALLKRKIHRLEEERL